MFDKVAHSSLMLHEPCVKKPDHRMKHALQLNTSQSGFSVVNSSSPEKPGNARLIFTTGSPIPEVHYRILTR